MSIGYLSRLLTDAQDAGHETDGTTSAEELSFLAALAAGTQVSLIAEVGFNAGFSSYVFLAANPQAQVYSFDLAQFSYSAAAKQHIDETFPDRHMLIVGDSVKNIPWLVNEDSDWLLHAFDLIFVDGGHEYDVALADLLHCQRLAHADTLVVMDDLTPWKPWGHGPHNAWRSAVESGVITQRVLVQDGIPVPEAFPLSMTSRVWALGTYNFGEA